MKYCLAILIGCITCISSAAQLKALTSKGDEVLLYEDGTWKYAKDESSEGKEVLTNKTAFKKADAAGFELKSKKMPLSVFFDPKKWIIDTDDEDDQTAEYSFKLKDQDAYGKFISERVEIPFENLQKIAMINAKNAAPDARITKAEYRMVNGLKMLHMQIGGTIQGMRFVYYGYYYSDASGTMQFVTFTFEKLLDEYKAAMEELLNGVVKNK